MTAKLFLYVMISLVDIMSLLTHLNKVIVFIIFVKIFVRFMSPMPYTSMTDDTLQFYWSRLGDQSASHPEFNK